MKDTEVTTIHLLLKKWGFKENKKMSLDPKDNLNPAEETAEVETVVLKVCEAEEKDTQPEVQ